MIKKFLSATLFGFLMLGLAGTFVACDDYDDSDLRRRVDAVEGTLADLKAQIANGVLIESITSSMVLPSPHRMATLTTLPTAQMALMARRVRL